jgi:hypothetical protein
MLRPNISKADASSIVLPVIRRVKNESLTVRNVLVRVVLQLQLKLKRKQKKKTQRRISAEKYQNRYKAWVVFGSFVRRYLNNSPSRPRCLCQSILAQRLSRCSRTSASTPSRRSKDLCRRPENRGQGTYRLGYVPRARDRSALELLLWPSQIRSLVCSNYPRC